MKKNLSIRDYATYNAEVLRFSYEGKNGITLVKPEQGEHFVLHEDFVGNRSLMWIVCITDDGEQWRHNADNTIRITFANPVNLPDKQECEIPAKSDMMFLQWSETLESFLKSKNIPFLTSDADIVAFKFGTGSDDEKVAFGMQFARYCDGITERVKNWSSEQNMV